MVVEWGVPRQRKKGTNVWPGGTPVGPREEHEIKYMCMRARTKWWSAGALVEGFIFISLRTREQGRECTFVRVCGEHRQDF